MILPEMEQLAVSSGLAVAYAIGLYLLLGVIPLVITALKGQWLLRSWVVDRRTGLVDCRASPRSP